MDDPFDLARFVSAQREIYDRALSEIRTGAKRSHWMWFIFPQIAGLGRSTMTTRYAISGISEAKAYLSHGVLGPRLRQITTALQELEEHDAYAVFGSVDSVKLRSSLTLFARADEVSSGLFHEALDRWFGGVEDPASVERL